MVAIVLRTRRNWKLETGKWKLETGKWKLEIGNWDRENGKCYSPAFYLRDRHINSNLLNGL
jgi:hypothetical protein